MDGNLNLGPWESGEHEDHSQSGLHRGLGLRFSQANDAPKPSYALSSRMLRDIGAQFGDGDQAGMKE